MVNMFFPSDFYLFKGFLVGFSVAGPVAIFCIRQTLAFGRRAGLAAGLGVSLADAVYSWIAAYSATFVEHLIHVYARWFYLIGGCFLIYLGYNIVKSKVKTNNTNQEQNHNLWKSFSKTLLLTFASPMTTLLFIGMFTAYGVFDNPIAEHDLSYLVAGVFFGAMTWWTLLAFMVKLVQKRLNQNIFQYINLISGVLILIYGCITLIKFISLLL